MSKYAERQRLKREIETIVEASRAPSRPVKAPEGRDDRFDPLQRRKPLDASAPDPSGGYHVMVKVDERVEGAGMVEVFEYVEATAEQAAAYACTSRLWRRL